ncbi:threonylcarbamoyl-AMP synthase [Halorubraceae archaeon YAN]|nr:threonylcarbamoyl-AMP synthase [Halorubraceae archaeon YAN]
MDSEDTLPSSLRAGAAALTEGEAVVYPTETVYGLGVDASNAVAVETVFTIKNRPHDKPLSIGVPDLSTAEQWARLTDRDRAFIDRFLPGPATVVVERNPDLPDALTDGGDRIGIRIPDHPIALELLELVKPLPVTATSANKSGKPSIRKPTALPQSIREQVAVVIDGGETPGGASTVVDVSQGVIHRRGADADAIEAWLAESSL